MGSRERGLAVYAIRIDGIFGEETLDAVIAFQTSCELMPNGIVDQVVRKSLTIT